MVWIKIYRNSQFLKECISIQEAGRFLQEITGDRYKRFNSIQNGYCYGKPWDYEGSRYTFEASEEARARRKSKLDKKSI